MAAIPATLAETGRRDSSSSARRAALSHGRGGAGNIGPSSEELSIESLETPTIKTDIYTTGRGGSGNMAKFEAAEARKAQDVVAHPRRESTSKTHIGRGGAANIFRPSQDDIERAKRDNEMWESAVADEKDSKSPKGFAEKGKDWLKSVTNKA